MLKKISKAIIIGIILLTATNVFGSSFSDIENHWANKAIDFMIEKNYVSGYSDNTLKPNNPITRGEFAFALQKVINLEISAQNSFVDVENGAWNEKAISTLKSHNIVAGTTDNTFSPNINISR